MAPPFSTKGPRKVPHAGSVLNDMGFAWVRGKITEKQLDDLTKVLTFAKLAQQHLPALLDFITEIDQYDAWPKGTHEGVQDNLRDIAATLAKELD